MRKVLVVVLIVGIVLLAPVPSPISAGTTWTVKAGAAGPNQATQALRFLPQEITINEGDTVQWVLVASNHTIFFPAGQKPPEQIVPGKVKGELLWNPDVFFPSPKKTYDGTGPLSGGVLHTDPRAPKSYAVTFTKAGTYNYVCMFHPGMEGEVIVQTAGSAYPKTQAQYDQIGAQEAQAALAKAQALREATKPLVTRTAGASVYTLNLVGSSKDAVSVYRFPAQTLTIRRGDSVTWVTQDPTDPHTVTFGMGKRSLAAFTVKPQPQGPPLLLVIPEAFKPAGGKIHRGGGFHNSGYMLTEGRVRNYTLTFSKAGTFEYVCLLHDTLGMKATIIVK